MFSSCVRGVTNIEKRDEISSKTAGKAALRLLTLLTVFHYTRHAIVSCFIGLILTIYIDEEKN